MTRTPLALALVLFLCTFNFATTSPSSQPSAKPSALPSSSFSPTAPSGQPTGYPTNQPTAQPSSQPSVSAVPTSPSSIPSMQSTSQPSGVPSTQPTRQPSNQPSSQPSSSPHTSSPSRPGDTHVPSSVPSSYPTPLPTYPIVDHPVLLHCRYSNDTMSIVITFDRETNKAELATRFSCIDLILNVSSAALCKWNNDARSIRITLGVTELLEIGDVIRLNGGILKAACPEASENGECDIWPVAPLQSCQVEAPNLVITPVVTIAAPATIDQCSHFVLDVSSSTGSGGQSFTSRTVEVTSSTGAAVAALQNLYDSTFSVNPPFALPSLSLEAFHTYTFKVTLCNFLGYCGYNDHEVSVVNQTIPTVSIKGGSQLYMYRGDDLVLDSSAFWSSCDASSAVVSQNGLSFSWKVYKNNFLIQVLKSRSRRKSRFMVNPYTLEFDKTYKFEVTVTIDSTGLSASASVLVNLEHSSVVAKVANNNFHQSLRIGDSTVINGALSFDRDYDYDTEVSGILYSWSCTQAHPTISSVCGLSVTSTIDSSTSPTSSAVRVTPISEKYVGTTSIVTLTVKSRDSLRVSTVVSTIVISNSTDLKLSTISSSSDIFHTDEYAVSAEIYSSYNYTGVVAAWSVDDTSLSMHNISKSSFSFGVSHGTTLLDLVISGSVLYPGDSYTFTMTVAELYSSVSVFVIEPPRAGIFSTSPIAGAEFVDKYVMSTSSWKSNNLPLRYMFGYLLAGHPESMTAVVQQSSARPFVDNLLLPSGPASLSYFVTTSVSVLDSQDSISELTSLVTVSPTFFSDINFANFVDDTMSRLNPDNSGDPIRAFISACISRMNRVTCFAAPSCGALNRESCLITQDTCGSCLDGYIGVLGDDNSLCYAETTVFASPSKLWQPCVLSSQCFSGQSCFNGVCSHLQRTCKPGCSSNGVCEYKDISTGEIIENCLNSDSSCEPVCTCNDGYVGSTCILLASALETKKSVRNSLVSAFNNTLQYHDVSSVSLVFDAPALVDMTLLLSYLTEDTCDIIYSIIDWFFMMAISYDVDYASLDLLLTALDNCNRFMGSSSLTQSSNRKLMSGGCNPPSEVIVSFTDYVEKSLAYGDAHVDFINYFTRIRTGVFNLSDDFNISAPITALETAFSIEKSSVFISSDNFVLSSGSTSITNPLLAATLEINLVKGFCNNSNFISNPIQVRLSLSPEYEIRTEGHINTTLAFTRPHTFISSSNESLRNRVVFITNCTFGNSSINTYSCPTGEVVTHECPGKDKKFISHCPEVLYHPECRLLIDGAVQEDNENCQLVSFTSDHVECVCEIAGSLSTFSSRSTSTTTLSYVGTFEVVAVGIVSSKGGVVSTNSVGVVPAEKQDQSGISAVILLCTLWTLGAFCVLYLLRSYFNDVIGEGESTFKPRRSLQVLDNASINDKKTFMVNYFNLCLPEIFQSFRTKVGVKDRLLGELYRCHRYAKLFVATGSKAIEIRLNNALHLLTILATLVLLLAFMYDVQYPVDDGSCGSKNSPDACLSLKTILQPNIALCVWVEADDDVVGPDMCKHVDQPITLFAAAVISTLASIAIIPFNFVFDYIFEEILNAPTLHQVEQLLEQKEEKEIVTFKRYKLSLQKHQKENLESGSLPINPDDLTEPNNKNSWKEKLQKIEEARKSSLFYESKFRRLNDGIIASRLLASMTCRDEFPVSKHRFPEPWYDEGIAPCAFGAEEKATPPVEINNKVLAFSENTLQISSPPKIAHFSTFFEDFTQQNKELLGDAREEFELRWGWSRKREMFKYEDFNVMSCHTQSASQNIYDDIEEVRFLSKSIYERLKSEDDCQIGMDLFQLLIVDILGRDSVPAKIFENKVKFDFRYSLVVTVLAKTLTCFALISYNVVIATLSTMLIADHLSETWQNAFAIACVAQFVLELFFSTMDCILWHFTIPFFMVKELKAAIRTMVDGIDHAMACASLWKEKRRFVPALETTSYFFVSRQVSTKFPHILECSVILSFMSMFPSGGIAQHFKTTEDVLTDTYSNFVIVILRNINLSVLVEAVVKVMGTLPPYLQLVAIRSIQPLAMFALIIGAVSIYQNLTLIFVPVVVIVYFMCAESIKRDIKPTLVLPLPFKSLEVEDDEDDSDDDDDEIVKDVLESVANTQISEATSSPTATTPSQVRWTSVRSTVVRNKPLAIKALIGQAKAQKLAIDEYHSGDQEKSSQELMAAVDEGAVNRIARLISESSGVSMETARDIARKEILKQFDEVRKKSHQESKDLEVLKPTESMSYIEMTLARASSSRASSSGGGIHLSPSVKAYDSGQFHSRISSPINQSASKLETSGMVQLANRLSSERSSQSLIASSSVNMSDEKIGNMTYEKTVTGIPKNSGSLMDFDDWDSDYDNDDDSDSGDDDYGVRDPSPTY